MAWGIFQKIGQGLKKAFNWVNDKVVKPVARFLKPITKPAGTILKTLIPGSAPVVDVVSDGIEHIADSGQPAPHEG